MKEMKRAKEVKNPLKLNVKNEKIFKNDNNIFHSFSIIINVIKNIQPFFCFSLFFLY